MHRLSRPLSHINAAWHAIRSRAGLVDVRMHDLRHSFASRALAACLFLLVAFALPGHAQTLEETRRSGDCRDLSSRGPNCGIGSSIDRRPLGYSEQGAIQSASDADLWSVILQRGQTYVIDVKGSGDQGGDNGGTLPDPSVEIYELFWSARTGWSGTLRASNDNASGTNNNASVVYTYPSGTQPQTPIGIRVSGANGAMGSYTVSIRAGIDCAADSTTTCTIAVGSSVKDALIPAGDVDAWAVTLQGGRTYQIDMRGKDSVGGTLEDPYLALHNPSNTEVANSDDDGTGKDARVSYMVPAGDGGRHIISLREVNDATGTYTLTVKDVTDCGDDTTTMCTIAVGSSVRDGLSSPSGDVDVWVVMLEGGKTYQIDLRGKDSGGGTLPDPLLILFPPGDGLIATLTEVARSDDDGIGKDAQVSYMVPASDGGRYFIQASEQFNAAGTYTLSVTEITSSGQEEVTTPVATVTETTDCPATTPTCTFDVGDTVDGALSTSSDIDSWLVDLDAGKTYQFDIEGRNGGDGALPDPTIILYDTGNTEAGSSSTQFIHAVETGDGGTYTLDVESDASNTGGYRITVTDITPSRQQSVREEAPPPAPPLTAEFRNVPAEHDGSSTFTFELHFSEAPKGLSFRTLRGNSFFDISNGTVTKAKRLVRKDNSGWRVTVEPDSDADVTIGLLPALPTADCSEAAVVCTAEGTRLLVGAATLVPGPASFSVADTSVQEAPGATLDFVVSLSRARHEATTVDYATGDGTATQGADYTATSATLIFEVGERAKTVSVEVLDDVHDDDGETVILTLSNASAPTRIATATATGTIDNTDPMPQAWLARFGRAAADNALGAIEARFRDDATQPRESHLTIGGLRVHTLLAQSRQGPAGRPLAGGPLAGTYEADGKPLGLFPAHGNGAGQHWQGAGGSLVHDSPVSDAAGQGGGPGAAGTSAARRLPRLRDLLLGASFFYSPDTSAPSGRLGHWAAWGATATTRFAGAEGPTSLDGEVATATLGLDSRWDRWMAGVALAFSEGQGAYTHTEGIGGEVSSSLSSLHPYAQFELNDRTSLWGVIGYGAGGLTLTPERAQNALETDLTSTMAAFGGRGTVTAFSGTAGTFELAVVSDARVTRTVSEAVESLMGATGATRRVRLLLEGRGSLSLATGGVLTPTVEAGLRYDDGDAETGAGVEIGAGLDYASGRLAVGLKARGLMAHEDTAYREWGLSASLGYQPRDDGSGLSLNLGSAWGVTQSGVQSLWSRPDAAGVARGGAVIGAGPQFQAQLGYGVVGPRRGMLWVPYVGADSGGGAQALQMGVRLASGSSINAELRIGRRQGLQGEPEHAVELRGSMRW